MAEYRLSRIATTHYGSPQLNMSNFRRLFDEDFSGLFLIFLALRLCYSRLQSLLRELELVLHEGLD